jgi:hypothetical protein
VIGADRNQIDNIFGYITTLNGCVVSVVPNIINFHSVFEAVKASDLFGWERHHNYGSLEFTVTKGQLEILKEKKIGFWLEDNN